MREVFFYRNAEDQKKRRDILRAINVDDRNFIIPKEGKVGAKLNKDLVTEFATFFEGLYQDFFDEEYHAIAWFANRLFYSSLEKEEQEVDFTNEKYLTELATVCFRIAAKFLGTEYPSNDHLIEEVAVNCSKDDMNRLELKILTELHDFEMSKTTPGQLVDLLVQDLPDSRNWRDVYKVLNYIPFIHVLVFHSVAMQVAASLVALEQFYGFNTEWYLILLADRLEWGLENRKKLLSVAEEVAEIYKKVFTLPGA